jgi:hypothetical protein
VQFLYINAHPPISIPFISLFIPLRCIAISQEAITLPYYALSFSSLAREEEEVGAGQDVEDAAAG